LIHHARRLAPVLGATGAATVALTTLYVVSSVAPGDAVVRGFVMGLVAGVPIIAGVYALRARQSARFGVILMAAGFAWSLTALWESSHSVPYSVGRLAGWLVFPSALYLMLAFPDGRIAPGLDRLLLRALNALLWVLFIGSALFVARYPTQTPWATCDRDCPANAFLVLAHEPAVMHTVVEPLRELLAVSLLAAVLVAMARRWRSATPLRRRMSRPVTAATAASTVLLAAFFAARWWVPGAAATIGVVWALNLAGTAAAFAIGLLRRRLLLAEIVAGLARRLAGEMDLHRTRAALASALGDRSLALFVPAGPQRWQDDQGRPAELPGPSGPSTVTLVRDNAGTVVVAIVHDDALRADEDLLTAVSALVGSTLRHQQVTVRLSKAAAQLEQSRHRIAEAADRERARIERDLHDGAQQRLLALRIRLSLAEEVLVSDPVAGAVAVREIGTEIDRTLAELHALAHGVYPAMLKDLGLAAALQSLARETPFPVHLRAAGVTRHPPDVEIAVYFTCAEALQNAIVHAPRATGVWIALRQDGELTLEVRDDGPGFTPPPADGEAAPGHSGLRNMRDRLEAIGGRLTIDAAPGHGTSVLGVVPLSASFGSHDAPGAVHP
jgi:signal transduction histidine kinase